MAPAVLAVLLTAVVSVPAGASLPDALARARRGDTVALGAGVHRGSLGRVAELTVTGEGEGATVVEAPEGTPGAVVRGAVTFTGLTLRAGPAQCALVVDGGAAALRDVALAGGACGAAVSSGSLAAVRADLRGGRHGLVVRGGDARVDGGSLQGSLAGVAVEGGAAAISNAVVFGPSRKAAVTVTGGDVALSAVVIASPGPAGIAIAGGRVRAEAVTIGGADRDGPSACVEALGGEVTLSGSELVRCGGSGVAASGARVRLDGVDVEGGTSGCLALVGSARGDLQGVRCTGRGPGLLLAGGATAQLRMDRWLVDPALVVECAKGSRATLLYGELVREPCASSPGAGTGR